MILITGATGTIGRPLIDTLSAAGVAIRAVTRTPHTANLPAYIEVVAGDPSQPDTIAPLLANVSAIFVHPRAVGMHAAALLARAREHGVQRVVTLAAINVDDALAMQPSRFRGDRNKEVEDAAIGSGMTWVSLRASTFASNTLQAWGTQIHAGHVVYGPYAAFTEAPIHERDLAEVGARALLDEHLVNRKLTLTGPQALSHTELVAAIGGVLGRPLRYQEIPPEAALQGMVQRGLPAPFVAALLARYARGVGEPVTDTVAQILGRPARTYAQWVADHIADFS